MLYNLGFFMDLLVKVIYFNSCGVIIGSFMFFFDDGSFIRLFWGDGLFLMIISIV